MDSIIDSAMEDEENTEQSERVDKDERVDEHGMTDEEIEDIAQSLQTRISVVGCGGGGCNTVDRIAEEGISGAELVAVNTDAQDLRYSKADTKLLIGQEACSGRGAGSVPRKGEESARENIDDIENIVEDQDMVFVTAGMGGGTGTGAAPVVAEAASSHALTIAVVTTPFTAEGTARRDNAEGGLRRLEEHADTVIVVPNDRLLDFAPNLPLQKAFKLADEVLMRSVKGITELITKPNLVNLDFADVQTVMSGGGVAMIGLGESDGSDKSRASVMEALESPLLDVNISKASNVLVNVNGGPNMQIEEAQGVVELLNERVASDSRIIWGAGVSEELQGTIRSMIVITGVESPQIYGDDNSPQQDEQDGVSDIDFVE